MNWRIYLVLGLLGLCAPILLTTIQNSPGYMDAEYYYAGGERLAQGYGFSEDILWNYLDDPDGIPHPSHGYWMPLPSILASIGLIVIKSGGFGAARLLFILLGALIPPLAAGIAFKLHGRKALALLSGGLALIPVFYTPYLATSDSFIPCMLIGGLFFWLLPVRRDSEQNETSMKPRSAIILGILSGLMHLARPDGAIWLLTGLAAAVICSEHWYSKRQFGRLIQLCGLCVLGYLIVMGPWFARNFGAFGTPLSPGGSRSLWIREYNEIFLYPAGPLTMQRWLATGWQELLNARLWAFGQNLQTTAAVQGEIVLVPLIILGAIHLRKDFRIRLIGLAWCLTLITMTIIFPFQGARGGFFHSGAGFQPVWWALAPIGLESFLEWGEKHRGWNIQLGQRFFGFGLLAILFMLTFFVTFNRVYSLEERRITWNDNRNRYHSIDEILISDGALPEEVVMVNNAPGYQSATGRAAISIPFADIQAVCEAAIRYRARYLILEIDQIPGEPAMFQNPSDRACFQYKKSQNSIHIYKAIQ